MGHPRARDWRTAMKFGQLHLFENPMDRSEKEIVDEQFDIMARAEEFGFDSVWPAEHHFSEYGYCASPAAASISASGAATSPTSSPATASTRSVRATCSASPWRSSSRPGRRSAFP